LLPPADEKNLNDIILRGISNDVSVKDAEIATAKALDCFGARAPRNDDAVGI